MTKALSVSRNYPTNHSRTDLGMGLDWRLSGIALRQMEERGRSVQHIYGWKWRYQHRQLWM